jgi:hypothetical protein
VLVLVHFRVEVRNLGSKNGGTFTDFSRRGLIAGAEWCIPTIIASAFP